MKPMHRKILFILCIIAFVVVAPILLFHTAGYRYDAQKNKFVKTGLLVVKVHPQDVVISINGEQKQYERKNDELRFKNLLPSEYEIRIEKEGYTSWSKKLAIESKKTTFTGNVQLFQTSSSEKLLAGNIVFGDLVDDNLLLIQKEANADNLILVNLKTRGQQTLFPQPAQNNLPQRINIQNVSWSINKNKVLINLDDESIILDTNNPFRLTYISDITSEVLSSVQWSNFGDHLVYGIANNNFLQVNLNSRQARFVTELNMVADETLLPNFFIDGSNIYFYRKVPGKIQFETINFIDMIPNDKKLLILNENAKLRFVNNRLEAPHFFDDYNEKLYIFNKGDLSSVLEFNAKEAQKNNALWLYHNEFELWVWNWEENKSKLINRYSQPIQKSLWYPKEGYIVFSHGNSIQLVELDTRDTVNQHAIINDENIGDIFVNTEGEKLFYLVTTGENRGLYSATLIDG